MGRIVAPTPYVSMRFENFAPSTRTMRSIEVANSIDRAVNVDMVMKMPLVPRCPASTP